MKNEQQWIKKVVAEEPLSLAETLSLENALDQQAGLRRVIENLEDDSPSLAWRSKLNERLLAETPQPKSKFKWLPVFGYGTAVTACAMGAYIMLLRPNIASHSATESQVNTESVLVAAHESSSFALDSASTSGAQPVGESNAAETFTWSEEDLGAL